jgi:hypothetical protein
VLGQYDGRGRMRGIWCDVPGCCADLQIIAQSTNFQLKSRDFNDEYNDRQPPRVGSKRLVAHLPNRFAIDNLLNLSPKDGALEWFAQKTVKPRLMRERHLRGM